MDSVKKYSLCEKPAESVPQVSGVYAITTPSLAVYVGSSINIRLRWYAHRSKLRCQRHDNIRLQRSYNKHSGNLFLTILEVCEPSIRLDREQYYVDKLKAKLNIFPNVRAGIYSNAATAKRVALSCAIAREKYVSGKRVPVESDDGLLFPSLTAAAKYYSTTASHIIFLCNTMQRSKSGVRVRRFGGPLWPVEKDRYQRALETRINNGALWHSEETKAKMKRNRANCVPSRSAVNAATIVNSKPVKGISLCGEKFVHYSSASEAARDLRPSAKCGSAQICKAIKGVKNLAYGYRWEFA